jgi:potassium-dependent mechanosensitive channel
MPNGVLLSADSTKASEAAYSNIPNPMELKSDWWLYFQAPVEELPEKIEKFKEFLEAQLPEASLSEKTEIARVKGEIFLNLDALLKKRSADSEVMAPPVPAHQNYTPDQLLELNKELTEAKSDVTRLNNTIEFKTSRYSWLRSKLDKRMEAYRATQTPSYEKLKEGLEIILVRIGLELEKIEISGLTKSLDYATKNVRFLSEETKEAKGKVNFEGLDRKKLEQNKEALQKKLEKAQAVLKNLQAKESSQKEDTLKGQVTAHVLYYKVLEETIYIQSLVVQRTLNDILLSLYDIHNNSENTDFSKELDLISSREKELIYARQACTQWENLIENDHLKISKEISDKAKENPGENRAAEQAILDIYTEMNKASFLIEEIRINISGSLYLIEVIQETCISEGPTLQTWSLWIKRTWSNGVEAFFEKFNVTLFYVNEVAVSIKTIIKITLTIFIALMFSKFFRAVLFNRLFSSSRLSRSTKYIILRLMHYVIVIFALCISLGYIGVDFTNITIILGALGIGIGFGLQSMVSNVIAGFTVLFNKYFKVGDIVELADGAVATVSAINLQFTQISSFDGANYIIPNSDLFVKGLKNWTMRNSYRRYHIPFGVAYGTDKNKLKKALLEVVGKESYVVAGVKNYHDPQLWFLNHGDSSLEFELVAWVNLSIPAPNGIAKSSLRWIIDDLLIREGIHVPFPQREITIKNLPKGSML